MIESLIENPALPILNILIFTYLFNSAYEFLGDGRIYFVSFPKERSKVS